MTWATHTVDEHHTEVKWVIHNFSHKLKSQDTHYSLIMITHRLLIMMFFKVVKDNRKSLPSLATSLINLLPLNTTYGCTHTKAFGQTTQLPRDELWTASSREERGSIFQQNWPTAATQKLTQTTFIKECSFHFNTPSNFRKSFWYHRMPHNSGPGIIIIEDSSTKYVLAVMPEFMWPFFTGSRAFAI